MGRVGALGHLEMPGDPESKALMHGPRPAHANERLASRGRGRLVEHGGASVEHDVCVVDEVLEDEFVRLRPLRLGDVDEWLAGEDHEQIRWFEFPRPARRDDVVQAIERWQELWQSDGPIRQWGYVIL